MILNNLRGLTEGLAGTPGVEETSDHLDGLLTNLVEVGPISHILWHSCVCGRWRW